MSKMGPLLCFRYAGLIMGIINSSGAGFVAPVVNGALVPTVSEKLYRNKKVHDDVIMETFSALLAIYAGNSPVPGEFPTQRPVTWNFDGFFDLRPNKLLSKQS